jgi:hypothetical protein
MELTENGINDTNIKKLFREIQMQKHSNAFNSRPNSRIKTKKAHCKRLQMLEKNFDFF